MVTVSHVLLKFASLLVMLSSSSAFWFTAEEPKPTSSRVLYSQDYYRQYVPPPLPYTIPLQVPLPAQLSPAAVQNVQLVPCLCPVNQEYSYENSPEYATRKLQPPAQQRRK
ncbi:uncharacterized protein LOC109536203 [Dendroctonus ponderosae]|uniref:VM domain-containing protein n=1 Tax=Dendroctonus ponderosae TaxID=77166 RepID=A0AAR5P9W2_DENPD|nr:uncharacterized protein LOC109536203 [Dendroctonus ponderosae]KAH1004150.1 hypothetical protein HUJ04_003948 [Dendroctonus ponderosae]KAH1010714.1 hypothetical protein HUJ05_004967 [Dendroctonus ponderosae]